jgi:hypothetical protein
MASKSRSQTCLAFHNTSECRQHGQAKLVSLAVLALLSGVQQILKLYPIF